MALRGRVDGAFDGVLRGWLWDPDRPHERLTAEIHVDGVILGSMRANIPRADLEYAGIGEGGSGFEFALPIAVQDGAPHEALLQVTFNGHVVPVDRLTLAIPRRLHSLRGRVERVHEGHVLGWASDRSRPEQAVLVELLHEGQVLAAKPANQPRADLARARIGNGRYGFAFDLAALQPRPSAGAVLELRCMPQSGPWPLGQVTMPASLPPPAEIPALMPAAQPIPMAAPSRRNYLHAARLAEADHDYGQAARMLDAGLLLDPRDFDLLSIRGRVHFALQELEPAERTAQLALGRSPDHPRALVLLARIYTALGRHEEAAAFWARIGPDDAAYRERFAKRPRSLLALGRPAETLSEHALALQTQTDRTEIQRQMALTAELAGAERAALSHWRGLLALLPDDPAPRERIAELTGRLAPPVPETLSSPLANADLRDWLGPIEVFASAERTSPAAGVALRALGGKLRASPAARHERRPGELPIYGLWLQAEGGGAEAAFTLGAKAGNAEAGNAGAGTDTIRMGIELAAGAGCSSLGVTLALRRFEASGAEMGERPLQALIASARPVLHRFDLQLDGEERAALRSGWVELVLRLDAPGTLLMRLPRAFSCLGASMAAPPEFETPGLPLSLPEPRPVEAALMDLACPFTSIVIAADRDALAATVERILGGTAAPFECILTIEPDWPSALAEMFQRMAASDPRLRLLAADALGASGWVALVEAPPCGGPHWLSALHRAAAVSGKAEAPGVLLEWSA